MVSLNVNTQELIITFMKSAEKKHSGTIPHSKPEFVYAIGLVEVCVAFEALINSLTLNEKSIYKKRQNFSKIYQPLFEKYNSSYRKEVLALKTELDKNPLEDMTPNTKYLPIKISNPLFLEEIIDVIYRVRSNLVHGSKNLREERNKILITNSFHLLYMFLEHIFREEKII